MNTDDRQFDRPHPVDLEAQARVEGRPLVACVDFAARPDRTAVTVRGYRPGGRGPEFFDAIGRRTRGLP